MIVFGFCAGVFGPQQATAQRPLGIDVSSFQGSSDNPPTNVIWKSVKSAGISFAWAKATEGTDYVDANLVYNMTNAKSAGVLIGAYHFCHPELHLGTAGADLEAGYFWNQVKSYVTGGNVYLMPMLDFEVALTNTPPYTQATLSDWVNEWCQDIVNFGASNGVTVKPVVYTYTSYAAGTSGNGPGVNSTVTNWPLWMASSGSNPQTGAPSSTTPWPSWTIWQYGQGTVSGVEGAVDEDVINGTSNVLATLVIGGPSISSQPASVTALPGTNVTFSVTASGGAVNYQWKFDGTNIPGATASEYVVDDVQVTNAGPYTVALSNLSGSVLSSPAFLSVELPLTNAPDSVLAPAGLVNWWTANGNFIDIIGGDNGTPMGNLYFSTGEVGEAFHMDGSTTIITTSAGDLAVPWTVCRWVNRQNTPGDSGGLLEDGTYALKLEQYNGTHEVGISKSLAYDAIFSPAYTVPVGTWTHLAFVGTSSGTTLYANGVVKGSLTNSIPLPREYIGATYVPSSSDYVDFMLGSLDEIMVFNKALTAAQINSIYTAGSAGLITAPAITGISVPTNGSFQLGFEGLTGRNFTIQSSPDLTNWTSVSTISNPGGTNQFTDSAATNAQGFYRVLQP